MEESFSPQQSLQLIESMIKKCEATLATTAFTFVLGLVFLSCHPWAIFLKAVIGYPHHYLVWLGVIPAVIVTVVRSAKDGRKSVSTYVGDSMKFLWTGIGVSFFVLSFIITKSAGGWYIAYPFFILFYGLGTFVSGMFLKFKPLIIGGIFNWVLACVCVWLPYDYQLLVAAAAILTSYIIPGHLIQPSKQESYGA